MRVIRRARKKAGDVVQFIFLIVNDTGCGKDITARKMKGLDAGLPCGHSGSNF